MGNLQHVYQELATMVSTQVPWDGHRQTFRTLIWMMMGVLLSRDVRLGRIAARSGLFGSVASIEQRYRRWLKNPRIKAQLIYDPAAKHLLFSRKQRRMRIQIDRTIVDGRFNVLMVTLYHRKRAIPLVWRVLRHGGSCSQRDWQPLLNRLDKLLSKRSEVIMLGDREFGTVDLMRFCHRKGWFFVCGSSGPIMWLIRTRAFPCTGTPWPACCRSALSPGISMIGCMSRMRFCGSISC